MSGAWNGKDGRAHLPTPEMLTSQDVLPAAAAGVAGSLSPFSLGFYSVDREPHAGAARDDSAFKCLPLLWVSDAVAEDRAKTSPPMESGWYLCVESGGGSFEARATVRANKFVKAFDRELPGADVSIVTLKVDGVDCMPGGYGVVRGERYQDQDLVFRGFVESSSRAVSTGSSTIRAFHFEKAKVKNADGDDDGGDDGRAGCHDGSGTGGGGDLGAFELSVSKGTQGAPQLDRVVAAQSAVGVAAAVSEKDALKKGTAVSVGRGGARLQEASRLAPYTLVGKAEVPRLAVRVRVRERRWLVSRRIVDDDGRPCTREKATEMVAAAAAAAAGGGGGPRPAKRVKTLPAGEVIDLT